MKKRLLSLVMALSIIMTALCPMESIAASATCPHCGVCCRV